MPIALLVTLLCLAPSLLTSWAGADSVADDSTSGARNVKDPANVLTVGNSIRVVHFRTSDSISPVVYPENGTIDYNQTYDLTFTALDAAGLDLGGVAHRLQLVDPQGTNVGSTRQAYNDTEHCGDAVYPNDCATPTAFANATFPNVRFNKAGVWTVLDADAGTQAAMILISPHAEIEVHLSPSTATYSSTGGFSEVLTALDQTGAPVAGATIHAPPGSGVPDGVTTDAHGSFASFQTGTPPVGTYEFTVLADVTGDGIPDVQGQANFTVTLPPFALSLHDVSGNGISSIPVLPSANGALQTQTMTLAIADDAGSAHPLCETGGPSACLNAATGRPPTAQEITDYAAHDVVVSGVLLSAGSASYDPSTGVATVSGLVPSGAGQVSFAVTWPGVGARTLAVPTANGALAESNPNSIHAGRVSELSVTVRDAFGNPAPTATITGLFEDGTPVTTETVPVNPFPVNGDGSPGFGQDGMYDLSLRPDVATPLLLEAHVQPPGGSLAVAFVRVEVAPALPNQPPTLAITSPASLENVSGILRVSGAVSDPEGDPVTVSVRVDQGPWMPAQGAAPWSRFVDTIALAEGLHDLQAQASDGVATSAVADVQFLVRNAAPPALSIDSPLANATQNGSVTVQGHAYSPTASLASVQWTLNGGPLRTAFGKENWSFTFDARLLGPQATADIYVLVTDEQGASTGALLHLNVDNRPDLALSPTDITVTQNPITTDGGTVPNHASPERVVHVRIHNRGATASEGGQLLLTSEAQDPTGLSSAPQIIARILIPSIPAGDSALVETTWNTTGTIGDVSLCAQASPHGAERDPDNNAACTHQSVLIGGLGMGFSLASLLQAASLP